MRVGDLSPAQLDLRLDSGGLVFAIGAFDVGLRSRISAVKRLLPKLYGDYPLREADALTDFQVELKPSGLLRRWLGPQVHFRFEGQAPFKPLPQEQSFAMFEWGLNWCIANHAHEFLVIHAAVVERDGKAFIFPGTPGSGKSTLCAALVCRGWRLLSDEMALVSLHDGQLAPVPRPISLKNASIPLIQRFDPTAMFGEAVADTAKGTVAHMRAPRASVESAREHAMPFCIVFPRYKDGAECELRPMSKGSTFMKVAENSFNYHVLGSSGFDALGHLVDNCGTFSLTYQYLEDALAIMEELHGQG